MNWKLLLTLLCCLLTLSWIGHPQAGTYYVSPTGDLATGDGSFANPWHIATALNHAALPAGSTIYLRGGTYKGRFTPTVTTSSSPDPITIRSYPNEWAIIDGAVVATLQTNLPATTTNIPCEVTGWNGYFPAAGAGVTIGTEEILLFNPTDATHWTCVRMRGGSSTPVGTHSIGDAVYYNGPTINSQGAYVIWRDLEITNTLSVNRIDLSGNNQLIQDLISTGIAARATGTKFINLIVHDTNDCWEGWKESPSSTYYGIIAWNCGVVASDRTHGHVTYHENITGPRLILENVGFHARNGGAQMYSAGVQPFYGGVLRGNVFFDSGNYDPANTTRYTNLIVGTNFTPIDTVTVDQNFFYHNMTANAGNMSVGYGDVQNQQMIFTNNYVAGGNRTLDIRPWDDLQMSGNTIYSAVDKVYSFGAIPANNFASDNNTFFDLTPLIGTCPGGAQRSAFSWPSSNLCGGGNPFATFKTLTGQEAASAYSQSAPPNAVFVRPNIYQTGRGHIIIYNWQSLSSVSANLSSLGLSNGQGFLVCNVQNLVMDSTGKCATPVLSGTYSASSPSISVPMNSTEALAVAPVYGFSTTPTTTLPEFGVFLVQPLQMPGTSYTGATRTGVTVR